MRSSGAAHIFIVGLVGGLASVSACSSGGSAGNKTGAAGASAGATGAAGTGIGGASGSAGAGGEAAAGASGSTGAGGAAGGAAGGGAAGQSAAGAGGGGGSGGMAGSAAGAGGQSAAGVGGTGAPGVDVTKVAPTAGCGKDPGQSPGVAVRATIQTMGTKAADCAATLNGVKKCGPWALEREYFVALPLGYDNKKAHPLIIEAPGCGGTGANLFPLDGSNVSGTVIRVGLTPPPNSIGHATNQNQNCFDERDGDNSVDFVFYENLWDKLAGQLCFDKNRVFAAGNSSGAILANDLGCKYAGDATHPIRGVMAIRGGLPMNSSQPNVPRNAPTCTTNPLAGIWFWSTGATEDPVRVATIFGVNRAISVDGCPDRTTVPNAMFEPFPIGGASLESTCRRIAGCSDLSPLVVCPLSGALSQDQNAMVNAGWPAFVKLFSAPPLLTP